MGRRETSAPLEQVRRPSRSGPAALATHRVWLVGDPCASPQQAGRISVRRPIASHEGTAPHAWAGAGQRGRDALA